VIKQYLPTQQIETDVQHWWVVSVGFVSEDDIQRCNEAEHKIIDIVIDTGPKSAGQLARQGVISLAVKDLIYFDVPVENTDQIIGMLLTNYFEPKFLFNYSIVCVCICVCICMYVSVCF